MQLGEAKVLLKTNFCHCFKRDNEGEGDEEVGGVWRDCIRKRTKRVTVTQMTRM